MDISSLGITSFIVFTLPGFISNKIYRSIYTVKTDSEWVQAANGIVSSLWVFAIISGIEFLCGSRIFIFDAAKLPEFKTIILLLMSGYLWGYFRVFLHWLKFYLSKKYSRCYFLYPDPGAVWPLINQKYKDEWVKVTLADNSNYLGWISLWNFNPDHEDFDFFLAEAKKVDDLLNPIYDVDGSGVYLNSRNVLKIEYFKGE